MPLISIVLPCYNGEKYLAQSIQSCIDQEYKHWELIIVDDCSTDSSHEIMEQFVQKDRRIHIVKNDINLKLPGSLNKGFEQAKGEYFTWTSDDNYYLKDALKELFTALQETNADMVYSGHFIIDGEGKQLNECHPSEPETLLYANYAKACFLYKQKVHEKMHGYDITKFLIEDYDFWLRIYLTGFKIIRLDKLLYAYRIHSDALTLTRKKDIHLATYQLVINNRKNFDKFPSIYYKDYWYYLIRNIKYAKLENYLLLMKNITNIIISGALTKIVNKLFKMIN
jgi:glycosyltransferase involved in cell wall biosynthesis